MSEKPQRDRPQSGAGVSPETSLTPEQAMLNEILDRAMPHIPDPPEEESDGKGGIGLPAGARQSGSDGEGRDSGADESSREGEAHEPGLSRHVSRETQEEDKTAPPPLEKNKKSSAYVYLAILFGAAFLMLLLAYFVQQRNNATVQDDLRSITASRQELLEDIQRLEEEKESLQQEQNVLKLLVEQLKDEKENAVLAHEHTLSSVNNILICAKNDNILNWLERFNDAGDWLMSGTLIQYYDSCFNEHNANFISRNLLPSQAARYLELREEVFDKAGCMVMESFYITKDESEYTERPYIGEGIFEDEDVEAARAFLIVLENYPSLPSNAAWQFAELFQTDSENARRLTGGTFNSFTVELFEQVRTDLLEREFLRENEDGTISTVTLYGEVDESGALV